MMEGQMKELPQGECPELAKVESEQQSWTKNLPSGQWMEYPQCCLKILTEMSIDDWQKMIWMSALEKYHLWQSCRPNLTIL